MQDDIRLRNLETKSICIYETQKDKEELSRVNPRILNQLKSFIDGRNSMKKDKALEVACGAGWVTKEVLLSRFNKVDLFDQCEQAIDDANENIGKNPKLGKLRVHTMQNFPWDSKWNFIVCRYCVGYLDDKELVQFLKKAAKCLKGNDERAKRALNQQSYIVVQDQVCPEDDVPERMDNQQVRTAEQLQDIF